MSGGSLDYVFTRLDDAIDIIKSRATLPEHRAFARHLADVSTALHDLEWVWSGDCGDGDELPALKKVVSPRMMQETGVEELKRAITDGQRILKELRK